MAENKKCDHDMEEKIRVKDFGMYSDLEEFLATKGIEALTNIKFYNVDHAQPVTFTGKNASVYDPNKIYILNYDKVLSKNGLSASSDVLKQCRNTVVRNNKVLACSFIKFLNLHEEPGMFAEWGQLLSEGLVTAYEKFDGSLIMVTYFDEQWWILTRGSNADANIFGSHLPKEMRSEETYGDRVRTLLELKELDKHITYVFELCDPTAYITKYDSVFLGLISANIRGMELSIDDVYLDLVSAMKKPNCIRLPEVFQPRSFEEIKLMIAKKQPDFEGYVLTCRRGNQIKRAKFKSNIYVELHKNKGKLGRDDALIERVLQGGGQEIAAYFPEYTEKVKQIEVAIETLRQFCIDFIDKNASLPASSFAELAKDFHSSWILFDLCSKKELSMDLLLENTRNHKKLTRSILKVMQSQA